MCYRIHQQQDKAQPAGATPPLESTTPASRRLRPPRWAGAAAAALIGALAGAAMLATPPEPAAADETPDPGLVATPVTFQRSVPVGGAIELTATTLDDGVPVPSNEVAQAGSSVDGCHHGM